MQRHNKVQYKNHVTNHQKAVRHPKDARLQSCQQKNRDSARVPLVIRMRAHGVDCGLSAFSKTEPRSNHSPCGETAASEPTSFCGASSTHCIKTWRGAALGSDPAAPLSFPFVNSFSALPLPRSSPARKLAHLETVDQSFSFGAAAASAKILRFDT